MEELSRRSTLAALGIVMLGGCGGGDGGSSAAAPPAPPPAPPPSPPPPPPPPPPALGTLGLTTAATLPALGYTVRASAGGWDYIPDTATYDFKPGTISMRFAPPDSLFLTVAGYPESNLTGPRSSSPSYFQGELVGTYYSALGGDLWLSRPVITEKILRNVIRGYLTTEVDKSQQPYLLSEFAYGISTAASALPTTGKGVYRMSPNQVGPLTVDFAARTVAGDITLYDKAYKGVAGKLDGVAFTADGTGFAGKAVSLDGSIEGTIEGRFFDPTGEELALRTAIDPAKTELVSQVAIGLRDP